MDLNAIFQSLPIVIRQCFSFLTFRNVSFNLASYKATYLTFAIITAWIAGLGRYWDHPDAAWWQYAGLGSVAYIFIMAFVLWLVVLPLRPKNWSYTSVFIFVGLTSPLAWLYAVPVERFLSIEMAISVNLWFLGIVAAWRVVLFAFFIWRAAKLRYLRFVMAVLTPLAFVMLILSLFNLQHVTFEVMAGIDRPDLAEPVASAAEAPEPHDMILTLGLISLKSFKYIVVGYIVAILIAARQRSKLNTDRKF